jgi:predicted GIY-YIG superfamily endonuclease
MLDSAKDPIESKLHKGVYAIPCSYGKVYIGETWRSIKTRLKEHNIDIQHGRIKQSAIVEHSHTSSHHICLENSRVLAKIPHHYKIKI